MKRKLSNTWNFSVLVVLSFTLCLCILHCNCKIFEPCELGEFFLKQNIPYDKIGDCYGIFLIGSTYWCNEEWKPTSVRKQCHIKCTKLLDDDLTDDLKCARLIYGKTNNFDNFFTFKIKSCSSNSSKNNDKYIGHCPFANGSLPQILNANETNVHFYLNEIKPEVEALRCELNGSLPMTITWQKNFEILESNDSLYKVETLYFSNDSLVTSKLYFKQTLKFLTPELKLTYWKCTGKNIYGNSSQDFFVRIYDPPLPPIREKSNLLKQFFTIGISSIVTTMLIILICIAVYKFWLGKRIHFTNDEIREFQEGSSIPIEETYCGSMYHKFRADEYNKKLEIDITDLTNNRKKCLGSGEYGEVYLEEYKGAKVAVKTSKKARINENSKDYIRSLLTEIKVLNHVKGHRNIIELIGAYTKELRKGKVYVLAEFCPYGSLESQLKKYCLTTVNKTYSEDKIDLKHEPTSADDDGKLEVVEINHKVMINWATQIASGMEWLGLKNVVHGDLAVRNVLLLSLDTVKITDFGLSLKLYTCQMKKTANNKFPWRSMPIETLKDNILSPQGDVWSFGICLWEIFSFAETPYSGIPDYNLNILNQIENGTLRNPQPPDTPEPVYDIMIECWKTIPSERPTFQLLRQKLFLEERKFSAPTAYVDFNEVSMNPQPDGSA